MGHVLVIANKLGSDEEKKRFEKSEIKKIKQNFVSPTTQFIYGDTKNSTKTIDRYKKRHPKAKIFDERLN